MDSETVDTTQNLKCFIRSARLVGIQLAGFLIIFLQTLLISVKLQLKCFCNKTLINSFCGSFLARLRVIFKLMLNF